MRKLNKSLGTLNLLFLLNLKMIHKAKFNLEFDETTTIAFLTQSIV